MAYKTFSLHAPTGADPNAKYVVSPNEYAPEGRTVQFPSKFSIYVVKISTVDGSVQIDGEPHTVDQIVGNRLYLYHRPLVDSAGNITTITASDGTINSAATNAKQGYIEFSSLPTGDFTVTYSAAPDCFSMWQLNNLQDDVMEIQALLGPDNQTGWVGMRHLATTILDKPNSSLDSLLSRYVSLPHLNQDVRISSTDDNALTGTLGDAHNIYIGLQKDTIALEGTGVRIGGTPGTASLFSTIEIGTTTGDKTYFSGTISGNDQVTIGGSDAAVASYSGVTFDTGLTQAYYDSSMLRVHGDIAGMGDLKVRGTVTITHTTGETSTVLGDFTIRDELFVHGISHLIGPTETNDLTVKRDVTVQGDLVASNLRGRGKNGHTLVDGLDASEVALTYKHVINKNKGHYVISAPRSLEAYAPVETIYHQGATGQGSWVVGDEFIITGFFTQAASSSGAYESILQLQWAAGDLPMVSGTVAGYAGAGVDSGVFSDGLIDPGSLWIQVRDGNAKGYAAPIFGYTIEQVAGNDITKLNVFTPKQPSQAIAANDTFALYSPGCEHWAYIIPGSTSSDVKVSGSAEEPLVIGFGDEIRVLTSVTADLDVSNPLFRAYSGMAGNTGDAACYIIASAEGVDEESPPNFYVRPTPFTMPEETAIGEVLGHTVDSGANWSIQQIVCYRPGGRYDSSWIPIHPDNDNITGGRVVSKISSPVKKYFFNHNLGGGIAYSDVSIDLYLASYGTQDADNVRPNQHEPYLRSLWGADNRAEFGLSGSMFRVSLTEQSTSATEKEASVFYFDSRLIGIQLTDDVLTAPKETSGSVPNYLRLVVSRNN
ncbi:MAG: hypothetical protein D6698_14215 [Gammaproteobacteria bacterium]|nr:MAG: hypothetical protein D6698_14215 [Gammaproteobacteria bacterium]